MENGLLKSTQIKRKEFEEVEVSCDNNVIDRDPFWTAIRVYVEKPHVVNKKICGFEHLWIYSRTSRLCTLDLVSQVESALNCDIHSDGIEKFELLKKLFTEAGFCCNGNSSINWNDLSISESCVVSIRKILPKRLGRQLIEVIILDGGLNEVTFIPETTDCTEKYIPDSTYLFHILNDSIRIKIHQDCCMDASSEKWLKDVLIPKLNKWAGQSETLTSSEPSLKCVDIQHYNQLYQDLKCKYGKGLVEMWTESTDPLKFVYEDIAIASYLIVLWRQEQKLKALKEKQSFVDIGCGNGLLVYLLSSEGYNGYGLDLRRRKIWDKYPDHVVLKEQSFIPSDEYLFPDYDWLIGNHSDELTPWIPVIAAKSGVNVRFMVIPCCAHDFQCKFIRMKSGVSQYSEYLDYVEKIGKICGFDILRDKLRIPSTKRVCFIGQQRTYTSDKYDGILDTINKFVHERCAIDSTKSLKQESNNRDWSSNFVVREDDTRVRNCTHIRDDVKEELLQVVASLLLKEENMIDIDGAIKCRWNKGVKVEISTIANALTEKQRSFLKKECGGLQTLLRNHRFIFVVQRGLVNFRVPQKASDKTVPSDRIKQKLCWFYRNHPQGCTLTSEQCTFIH